MKAIGGYWATPWVVFGDFNATGNLNERSGGTISRAERWDFNCFVEDCGLLEFDKAGPKFLFYNNHSPPTLSKLD